MINPVYYGSQYGSADTSRGPSNSIWKDCPVLEILRDPGKGVHFYDDFQDLPLYPLLTTQIAMGKYKVFGDTGNTIIRAMSHTGGAANALTFVPGGFLELSTDTDNDEVAIAQAFSQYNLSGSTSNSGKLWFEACYIQNGGVATGTGSITGDAVPTNCASVFLGVANTGPHYVSTNTITGGITLSTTVPLNDGDPISNTMYGIGFRIAEDGLGVVDTVVTDGATSFTNIGATEAGTVLTWTQRKLGFIYDPYAAAANRIIFYANGIPLTTNYTSANLTALTNLKAVGLGLILAATADTAGTAFKCGLKWWRCAQLVA